MAELFVDFNFGKLSDRMLNEFLRGFSGQRHPLARALADELLAEKAARQQPLYTPRDGFGMQVDIDPGDDRAMTDVLDRLFLHATDVKKATWLTPPGSAGDVELSGAMLLLLGVRDALRDLRRTGGAAVV